MKPVTVTVYWSKGGVGKSTLVQILAAFGAGVGMRVVIVDMDLQGGQSALWECLDPDTGLSYEMLHQVIRREVKITDALRRVDDMFIPKFKSFNRGTVMLVEGGPQTQYAIDDVAARPVQYHTRPEHLISGVLSDLDGIADIVLLDMGPSNQVTTLAALDATDYLVLPTLMDRSSVERTAVVLDEVEVAREVNSALSIIGIIPTMTMYYFGGLRTSPNVKAGRELLETAYSEYLLRNKKGGILELPYSEDYTRARWAGTNILAEGALRPSTMEALAVAREVYSGIGIDVPEVSYA
ncbi:MAG TPA: ParA family protein [Aggregatilinea sp.]|uniref:ParA family protein n=1 Tax=Aggregatilinea sp. TaxID=2806333 RepID=UPI002B95310B|nr:ParA family protein [Aggregatilinea sp.]HML21831.1 ParA family protein [Aggregatilinea sp.]